MSALTLPDGELRAITIRQPFPFFLLRGDKTIETRSQPCSYRGPVAIHAGVGVDHIPADEPRRFGAYEVERDAGGLLIRSGRIAWPYRLPLGQIVAVAELVDCLPIVGPDDETPPPCIAADGAELAIWSAGCGAVGVEADEWSIACELPYGDFTPGRYGLVLADVVRLPEPVPARGQQAVPWRVPEDVADRVREQLAGVAR